MTQVKICGIQRVEDALVAADAGADLLGFIFAPSRRRVAPHLVSDIISEVRCHYQVATVGVFVNEDSSEMNRIARRCDLDYVQLSGDESDDVVGVLDVPTIQVIHMRPEIAPEELSERVAYTPAEVVLLDTAQAGSFGGTGVAFDWTRVPHVERPILLAGGLHADNVAEAIRAARPWGVDVSSGVETRGEKDQTRIREFVLAARAVG